MSQASSRRLTTSEIYTQRPSRQRLRKTRSDHTIKTTVSLLSKTYGILPCFCEHNPKRYQAMILSKSSNAFGRRKNRSKVNKSTKHKQQRNNSSMSKRQSKNRFQTLRKSLVQRFKRNKKKRTITARSIIRKRSYSTPRKLKKNSQNLLINHSNTSQMNSLQQSSFIPYNSEHSLLSQNHLYVNNEIEMNDTLEPPLSSFQTEQQNVNATNNFDQRMIKNSSSIATSKRKTINNRSPFPNPHIFQSLRRMHDIDEITENNVHENHLCCKPITSVKGLSTNDQKKLIENDYLTLISLLPMYLGSQGHFSNKLQEKIKLSSDGANELDRLMNEWSSTRLYISATNPNKILVQKI